LSYCISRFSGYRASGSMDEGRSGMPLSMMGDSERVASLPDRNREAAVAHLVPSEHLSLSPHYLLMISIVEIDRRGRASAPGG